MMTTCPRSPLWSVVARAPRGAGLALTALVLSTAACAPAAPSVTVGDFAEVELALTDPGLLGEIETFVAVNYFVPAGSRCADLLELDTSSLDDISRTQEPISGAMAVPARDAEGAVGRHGFGGIYAPGEYSFMLLGSTKPFTSYTERGRPLEEAAGTVIAMGCRDVMVLNDERQDLRLNLFPAGVR